MTLDPAFEPILTLMAPLATLDWAATPVDVVRGLFDNPIPAVSVIAMARVEDVAIVLPGRSLVSRLYVPENAATRPGLTVYFHGGGWVIGTLETHDGTCRALARASGAAVLSVGYRLAPEHIYPTAVDDCFAATCWAVENADKLGVDGHKLAVAGDSAGGNLAAAVAIMARDAGGPTLAHQMLIYPVTDFDFTRPSYLANGDGNYFLSTGGMKWFWQHYLGHQPAEKALLAAVLHQHDLSGLAPATVITAQYDPLADEGLAYAAKLAAAGVAVDTHQASGMIHGFFGMFEAVPNAQKWIDLAGANIAHAFGQ